MLHLRRFPDDAPLDTVAVQLAPTAAGATDAWLTTDAAGSIEVAPADAATALLVRAVGYEPIEAPLERSTASLELALTPSSGLFGRVVRSDGSPVRDVDVIVEATRRSIAYAQSSTRANPSVQVFERSDVQARARSNERGWFYLACETRLAGPQLTLSARSSAAEFASLVVVMPHPAEPLPDLVLGAPARVVVQVLDENGVPIPGAHVWSQRNRIGHERATTDGTGRYVFVGPSLPAAFGAGIEGHTLREVRHDGVLVAPDARVQVLGTHVELVLGPQDGMWVRVIDAQTRLPIRAAEGSARRVGGGESLRDFETDASGEAWIPFEVPRAMLQQLGYTGADPNERAGADERPARMSVTVGKAGFVTGTHEVEVRGPSREFAGEVALEPESGLACIRGRVLRAGVPVPGVQLGLKVYRSGSTSFESVRDFSDAQGEFALRWHPSGRDASIVVHPHWTRWDEFGFVGPLSVEQALAGEHVLELAPSVRVPAILRNAVRGGAYFYYVALLDGERSINTTINGAPLAVDQDGEARTTLLLPSDRRARVTIGWRTEDRVHPNGSPPVDYDPANRGAPLVFDVESRFARISGRLVGFDASETAALEVGFVGADEQSARTARVTPAGDFELVNVTRGHGRLFVVRDGGRGRATVLAVMELVVEGDTRGLLVARDVSSLPETSGR